ncbi:MAG: stage 0 sporulation family protein [Ruminococcus sp.]|nr:stage 0 sporulation family protein [Ruminococcus sp.]
MLKIIGVRFKSVGKIYYFDPGKFDVKEGEKVIVETARGVECGEAVIVGREIDEEKFSNPIKQIIRVATPEDMKTIERNREKEKDAMKICEQKIRDHKLKMNLIDCECTFDNNKLLFYFTAENRVDFRELVKDLASVFRTRIELRQIGVRDEAKMLGGLGICGQPFCCSRFLGEFQPVSIKMAKEQGLSLNPTKISGTCGRLMCCLKYEQESYEDLLRHTPKVGAVVKTAEGKGVVQEVNLLTGKLRVKIDQSDNVVSVKKDEVEVIRDAVIRVDRNEMKALKKLEDK